LTQITAAPPTTVLAAGFAFETQRSKQIIYVTPDGHIYELSVILGGGWSHADLTAITGAPPASFRICRLRLRDATLQASRHVTNVGNVYELSVILGGSWSGANLLISQ
jgi:hypothetical protein